MKPDNRYSEILRRYPRCMTKEQMYQVCHISKKTCLYLLESGLVPCRDSGKKTRRFTIETAAVVRYLEERELNPERFKPPAGHYKSKRDGARDESNLPVAAIDPLILRQMYEAELERYPDVLPTRQISDFTGYEKSSVERWCTTGHLKHFFIRKKFLVPKDYLLEFIESPYYIGIAVKSELHKKRNRQILAQAARSTKRVAKRENDRYEQRPAVVEKMVTTAGDNGLKNPG